MESSGGSLHAVSFVCRVSAVNPFVRRKARRANSRPIVLRMCIGLAYPPASIPELKNLQAPITEVVPLDDSIPPRRLVHFDFDPRNSKSHLAHGTEENY